MSDKDTEDKIMVHTVDPDELTVRRIEEKVTEPVYPRGGSTDEEEEENDTSE
jgi:hypothetical protein